VRNWIVGSRCLSSNGGDDPVIGSDGRTGAIGGIVEAENGSVKGKVAFVTGAASGIGRATAIAFARARAQTWRSPTWRCPRQAGGLLLGPLRRSVAERARVAPLDQIAIATAELGPHAGAIGAALWGAENLSS
jgi:hypothetical protein